MNTQDQQIVRQMIQQEMMKSSQADRFNMTNIKRHQHKNDTFSINQNDITPGNSTTGTITLAQVTTYNIGVNFNPTTLDIQGNVTGASGEKFLVVGVAQFGPGFYLQPGTSTSVIIGGQPETIIQSCCYIGGIGGGALHTVADQGHIVDVEYGGVHARATVTGYSNKGIIVQVNNLDSGWAMNLNFTIS